MNAVSGLPTSCRLITLGSVGSSNDEAARLAADGAPEGTVVWVAEQRGGRGRRGRSWQSPPGNLYLSAILRPDCGPAEGLQVGFAAALAITEAAEELLPAGTRVRIKWPNDVLVNGAKLSGILLESSLRAGKPRLDWLIVGMGVNVATHPPATDYPATCLAEAGSTADVPTALAAVLRRFFAWRHRWGQEGFVPLRDAWLARAHRPGETIEVRREGETLRGRFAGLDPEGVLLLDIPGGGHVRIGMGDVFPAAAGA